MQNFERLLRQNINNYLIRRRKRVYATMGFWCYKQSNRFLSGEKKHFILLVASVSNHDGWMTMGRYFLVIRPKDKKFMNEVVFTIIFTAL